MDCIDYYSVENINQTGYQKTVWPQTSQYTKLYTYSTIEIFLVFCQLWQLFIQK